MRILRSLFLLLWPICLIAAGGCQGLTSSPSARPRIISLAPSITEILFALDLEKNIVGVTTCCDYPAAAKNIERVATFSAQANLERILALNPDIVFSTGLEQEPIVQKLRSLNIKVILVYPRSLSELFASILEIGRLTRREGQAQDLVDKMRQKINRVSQKVASVPEEERPKVFVEISADPLITAGKGSFIDQLITLAGGRNIAYDTQRAYSQFSPELVLKRNPDVIILGYMKPQIKDEISKRVGWQGLSCVKKGRIVADIDPDLFLRPGPRITEGLEQIHLKLFPR